MPLYTYWMLGTEIGIIYGISHLICLCICVQGLEFISPSMKMFKAVLLKEERDNVREITIREKDIHRYLNGPATFIGSYPEYDVVVIACRIMTDRQVNQNTLPPPMYRDIVYGPIILTKMEPLDFTLDDWESMRASLVQP